MEQPRKKKAWAMPEVIVLVRRKPEEAVLLACKTMYGAKADDVGTETGCVSFETTQCGVQCNELPNS